MSNTEERMIPNILDPECPLDVVSKDEMGPGGAYHVYEIRKRPSDAEIYDEHSTAATENRVEADCEVLARIEFQKGGIAEKGVNGITQEALLMVIIDRLDCFSKGPFPSRPSAIAKTDCESALNWLQYRTAERQHRGVEGHGKA